MKKKQWFFLFFLPLLLKSCILQANPEERCYLESLLNSDSEKNEDLKQWLDKTEQELLKPDLQAEKKVQLHEFLARAYLYLERLDQLKKHALDCIKIGIKESLKGHVKGLNLLSIYYSVLSDTTDQLHHKLEYYYKSRATSQRALVLLDCGVDPLTEAEVYFHAATLLCSSFSTDLFRAISYYQKAMDLFEQENQIDDYLKAKVHLAKAYLQLKAFSKTEGLIEEMHGVDMQKKTLTSLHRVEEELLKELGQEKKSFNYS